MTNKNGFVLMEAIASIVIVSICLTFIVQSLLTNFRTGVRFQETLRALMVMENRLGALYATNGSQDLFNAFPKPLGEPYEKFTFSARADAKDKDLKRIGLSVNWPRGRGHGRLEMATVIFAPDENPKGT